MAGIAKKKYREAAEMLATYGPCTLRGNPQRSYELYVGLWLNQWRIETRFAYRTLTAVQAALELVFGGEPLKGEWFDAALPTAEAANTAHGLHVANVRLNTQRLHHRAGI